MTLQSLNPIYVNFGVPQQSSSQMRVGRTVRITSDSLPGVEFSGRLTAIDSIVDQATRNIQVQATLANPGGKLRPGMFVQAEAGVGGSSTIMALPASAISYAPFGDSVFVVTDLKNPAGQSYRGVRQQFVKLGPARGDQIAVTSGVKPGDEVVTSGLFKLRNGAPSSSTTSQADQQSKAEAREQLMKFTDLFVKRPVLAIVVNLVILIAGVQSIRALSVRQYPRSDIAVVRVSTAYVGANADLVRGFITTPLERVIASADGIDYMESSSAQGVSTITFLKLNYDTNAAFTQIQARWRRCETICRPRRRRRSPSWRRRTISSPRSTSASSTDLDPN